MQSSLAGTFWGGYCPDCMTTESMMCKNEDDHMECPVCHLQIKFVNNEIVVTDQIGHGNFVKRRGHRVSVEMLPRVVEGSISLDMRFAST